MHVGNTWYDRARSHLLPGAGRKMPIGNICDDRTCPPLLPRWCSLATSGMTGHARACTPNRMGEVVEGEGGSDWQHLR